MQRVTRTRAERAGGAVLAALLALFLAAYTWGATPSEASHGGRPHVILLTTDDQTVRDMLALPQTQALIGGAGASFTRAYTSFPLCCPSRASMLTGQYAHNNGVLGNIPPLGGYSRLNDGSTVPVWLQGAGYRTIHIGKMPNGYGSPQTYVPPGFRGFPLRGEFYGFLPDPPSAYFGFKLNENGLVKKYEPSDYQTDVYADLAVDRIDKHFRLHPGSPLYMQVHFFAPHDPNLPAPRHAGAFATLPPLRGKGFNEKKNKDKPRWLRRVKRMGPGLVAKVDARSRGRLESLLAVEEAIQRILSELAGEGALSDTYVIFTSDNGFMQGQHRLHQGKFVAYDQSSRVPLLVRGPGIPPGGASKELVSNVDIAPTILEAAGVGPGIVQDGRSFLRFARDPRARSKRPILIETGPPGLVGEVATVAGRTVRISRRVKNLDLDGTAQISGRVIRPPRYRGLRTGRYLFVKYSDGSRELYDTGKDRFELENRYGNLRYRPVRSWFLKTLKRYSGCSGKDCRRKAGKPPKPLSKSATAQLRRKLKQKRRG